MERGYGRFTRSFALPAELATDRVRAAFTDGALSIEVPKAERSKPRRVEIG